jgi:hypothetical protein
MAMALGRRQAPRGWVAYLRYVLPPVVEPEPFCCDGTGIVVIVGVGVGVAEADGDGLGDGVALGLTLGVGVGVAPVT